MAFACSPSATDTRVSFVLCELTNCSAWGDQRYYIAMIRLDSLVEVLHYFLAQPLIEHVQPSYKGKARKATHSDGLA